MVRIENIAESKGPEAMQLAKEVFGKSGNISVIKPDSYEVYIIKNRFLSFFPPFDQTLILAIDTYFDEFKLYKEKYFDKTKELAQKYEKHFKAEVTIKTDYSKKQGFL
jgi:hypothetical protein